MALFCVKTPGDAVVFGTVMSVSTCLVVALYTVFMHEPDMWWQIMPPNLILTFSLTFALATWGAMQLLRVMQKSHRLRDLLDRDPLSGAATRDRLFRELKRSSSEGGVLLMLDIDHFKRVNDTLGHLAGDDVIRAVAECMQAGIREEDLVCRYGGEEFVVFLKGADETEGHLVAERMRACIASRLVAVPDGAVSVTVSVGGAMLGAGQGASGTLRQADLALYRAKRQGRNRTVMAWGADATDLMAPA